MAEMDQSLLDGMNRAERNAFLDGIQTELDALDEARERGDWEAALSGAQSLQQRFPTIAGLYLDIGTAQAQLGQYQEAIESYEAAAAAAPRCVRRSTRRSPGCELKWVIPTPSRP